ncbi:MAG: hypothetical protein KGR69_03965 [Verrucomicrobia bacterium]|nr:hypothetical protein [Verrucomicrobiota bacterium]
MIKFRALCLSVLAAASAPAGEPVFTDPFTAGAEVPERRAMRGDRAIAGGIARCTQDDALYTKYKNHGPILFHDLPAIDAAYRFAVKPKGCRSIVFTLNGEKGHVFRFVTGAKGTGFRAFPPGSEKSIQTGLQADWKFPEGEWTNVSVAVTGSRAVVTFGDHPPVTIEHAGYGAAKVNFSIGFAFGTLEVKDVAVTG